MLCFVHMPQHDVDGKAYYTFEFVTQAPNYIRHALTAVTIGNGMKLILNILMFFARLYTLQQYLQLFYAVHPSY